MEIFQISSYLLSVIGIFLLHLTLKKAGDSFLEAIPFTIGFLIISTINFLLIYYSNYLKNSNWSYSQIGMILSIFLLTYGIYRSRVQNKNIIDWLQLFILAVPLLISMITGILYFSNERTKKTVVAEEMNLTLLENSVDKVKDNFTSMEELIGRESKNIELIFDEIRNELEIKNDELENIKKRESELLKQVEYYQNLASLSEDQVKAVNKALHSNRNQDLIISFVIGFFASLMVWIISETKFVKRLFK